MIESDHHNGRGRSGRGAGPSRGRRRNHRPMNNSERRPQLHESRIPHNQRAKVWWKPFTKDEVPDIFKAGECRHCAAQMPTPWLMVEHLCSVEHCVRMLCNMSRDTQQDFAVLLRCEICLAPLNSVSNAKSHFRGHKHKMSHLQLKNDLREAGFVVDDGERCHSATESEIARGGAAAPVSSHRHSLDEYGSMDRDDRYSRDERGYRRDDRPPFRSERSERAERGDDGSNWNRDEYRQEERYPTRSSDRNAQPFSDERGHHRSNDRVTHRPREDESPAQPGLREPVQGKMNRPREDEPEQKNLKSEEDKEGKGKHQFFLSSGDDDSDDEKKSKRNLRSNNPSAEGSPGRSEGKKVVPVISCNKSIVDKRKDIISRLSSCTDVRDLSKHLKQITRNSDEKSKNTRKALPGVAFSNNEIIQQETFGEARAALLNQSVTVDDSMSADEAPQTNGDNREDAPVLKAEAGGSKNHDTPTKVKLEADCEVVAAPRGPPPQIISDSEEEPNPALTIPTQVQSRPASCGSVMSLPLGMGSVTGTRPVDDLNKLTVIISQERALSEKLQYILQMMPRIESLRNQLAEEHRRTASQLDLLRNAKLSVVSSISQEPQPPPGAELLSSSVLLSSILQPTNSTQSGQSPWLSGGGADPTSFGIPDFLQNIGVPPSPAASLTSLTNGGRSSATETAPVDRKRNGQNETPISSKRIRSSSNEQIHSETVFVVRLCPPHVYTSSRDGIVKRTPLNEQGGSVKIYKHSGQDTNSGVKRICAHMLEVYVNKKADSTKVITGADDCALRVFDGETGHLIKVIPVQAKVVCGSICWQKIYTGLKSGFIQVYNLIDQCFIVESKQKHAPKLVAHGDISNCKSIVVVNEDNSLLMRNAGTLFVLYAVEKLDQDVTGLFVKGDHVVVTGKTKIYVLDKSLRMIAELSTRETIYCSTQTVVSLIVAFQGDIIRSFYWNELVAGSLSHSPLSTLTSKNLSGSVVTSLDAADSTKKLAISTDKGQVVIMDIKGLIVKAEKN